jgi:nucleoid DNA-binding protein
MTDRIGKEEIVRRLAKRMKSDEETAAQWVEAFFETLYDVFKSGKGVTLPGFGGFYLKRGREGWAFKFNPGQRLRALFGWSSTYKGPR